MHLAVIMLISFLVINFVTFVYSQQEAVKSTLSSRGKILGDISRKKCIEYATYLCVEDQKPIAEDEDNEENDITFQYLMTRFLVGGERANKKEFPHMALIGYGNRPIYGICGGSLISENFILSAAHCASHKEHGNAAWARLGIQHIDDKTKQEVQIMDIIVHPQYQHPSYYHDIVLFKISKVELNQYVGPLCLNTKYDFQSTNAVATGWGKTDYYDTETSRILMKVDLKFYGQSNCSHTYRRQTGTKTLARGILDDSQICAGSDLLKDTCQGDSGGPLQIPHNEDEDKFIDPNARTSCMYNIIGITSFGKACGMKENIPSVYTRVSNYIKWIEDTVWPQ